jgi:GEVED domain/CARDB
MISNKLTISSNCRLAIYCLLSLFMGMNQLNAQTYCASKGNVPWQEWIAGVKFGTINNASVKEGYGNFTSQTTNLTRGTSYPLSITQGFSYAADAANATQQGKVWIDYNQNKVFEATELVASFTRTTTTANVAIPTTALLGATRMRVSLKTIGVPTVCEVFDKGEVEDYTVNITGGTTALPDLVLRGNLNCRIEAGRFLQTGSYYLKNIGLASVTSEFYTIVFYLSSDANLSSNDIPISTERIRDRPTLASGDSVGISPTNAALGSLVLPAGNYYVIAKADGEDQITEGSETNNTLATALQITVPPVVNNTCRYQDSLQLVSLYNATNGANWTKKWNLATPINT